MTDNKKIYLSHLGLVNALGFEHQMIYDNMLKGFSPGMGKISSPLHGKTFFAGEVTADLPQVPSELSLYDCRNNRLALAAVNQIKPAIERLKQKFGGDRIGVVMGTSTSGVAEAEQAFVSLHNEAEFPEKFHYKQQEMGSLSKFLASYLALEGPSYVISTACSSSGKVFASARGLIALGVCDAVIVGGVDSLCEMTLAGFASLEAVSDELTNPFSVNRKGINIGEAAAIFVMTQSTEPDSEAIELSGVGESSDAHHMSAPDPEGKGAVRAIQAALVDAQLQPEAIDYINLHGTGTQLNDIMESKAVSMVFGDNVPVSSTKPLTGHTLGAAGATDLALCWLLMKNQACSGIPHRYDGCDDPQLSQIRLCRENANEQENPVSICMSNSFAFGGNNVSVIIQRSAS